MSANYFWGRGGPLMKNMWGMNFLQRVAAFTLLCASMAFAQSKPNIIVIMGDDVGWENIGGPIIRA